MEKKSIKKNSKIEIQYLFLVSLSLVIMGTLFSFAITDLNVILSGENINEIKTCKLDLTLLEKNPVKLLESYPIADSEISKYDPYEFTVKSEDTNTCIVGYNITMVDYCNICTQVNNICEVDENISCNCNAANKLSDSLIKYQLVNKETQETITGTGPIANLGLSGAIRTNEEVTYQLKMWITSEADGNDLYVFENGAPKEDENGIIITKNYCSKLQFGIESDIIDPAIESISVVNPVAGRYGVGQTITIDVNFDEVIQATQAPTLTLNFGGVAARGTVTQGEIGSNKITYNYTIVNGDNGNISVNSYTGGNVADASLNEADLTLPASITGNVVAADTTKPTCTLTTTSGYTATKILTINTTETYLHANPYSFNNSTFNTTNTKSVATNGSFNAWIKDDANNVGTCSLAVTNIGYTVTYNANGGSGAPAAQTKIYGNNLTLSTTAPTRTNFIFLGWSTSSTATTVTYAPGATYTGNSALNLYAVWTQTMYYKILTDNPTRLTRNSWASNVTASTNNTIYQETRSGYTYGNTPVYYFAGAPTNNWVLYGGYYWRIVRTNEDQSVRLIYVGADKNTTNPVVEADVGFNSTEYNNWIHNGYMYNTTTSSTVKTRLESWYSSYLSAYTSGISQTAMYCNDMSIEPTADSWNADSFGPRKRNENAKTPNFLCPNAADRYSKSTANGGNGKLTYPVGMLDLDEAAYAGAVVGTVNSSFYLTENSTASTHYHLMSPGLYYHDTQGNRSVQGYSMGAGGGNTSFGFKFSAADGIQIGQDIRPVISLKSCVRWSSGNGTKATPYQVVIPTACASAVN